MADGIEGDGAHGLSLTRREGEGIMVETPDGQQLLVTLVRVDAGRAVLRFTGSREQFNIARLELRLRSRRV